MREKEDRARLTESKASTGDTVSDRGEGSRWELVDLDVRGDEATLLFLLLGVGKLLRLLAVDGKGGSEGVEIARVNWTR